MIAAIRRRLIRLRTRIRETHALRARSGPYRFLVKDWRGLDDLERMSAVCGTDFFLGTLQPLPLPLDRVQRLLLLAPHQDDESIGAGGTLTLAGRAGAELHIAFVTDGAQRDIGYADSTAESIAVRDREAAAVCKRLGATRYNLGLSNLTPRPTIQDLDALIDLISRTAPDVVLLPWVLDRPAKHRLVNHMLALALDRRAGGQTKDFEIWGYQVHNALFANSFVDITSAADDKRALLALYRSQNEHCQRWDHLGMASSAWASRLLADAPTARYVEPFFTLPRDTYTELVLDLYSRDLERTYHGHVPVLEAIRRLIDEASAQGTHRAQEASRHETRA